MPRRGTGLAPSVSRLLNAGVGPWPGIAAESSAPHHEPALAFLVPLLNMLFLWPNLLALTALTPGSCRGLTPQACVRGMHLKISWVLMLWYVSTSVFILLKKQKQTEQNILQEDEAVSQQRASAHQLLQWRSSRALCERCAVLAALQGLWASGDNPWSRD